ncbi:MAG: DoxX family protein [Actinobacteria bacterium]|nr:DoxX family protein [Actinomycetota bacterium]
MDVGVLVIRLAVGLIIAAHGTQKLFGWFDGPGIGGTAGMLESMGFTPARPFAILTGTSEMMGGLALALIGVALPYPTAGILALIVGLGMGLGVATLSSLAVGRHKFKSLNA